MSDNPGPRLDDSLLSEAVTDAATNQGDSVERGQSGVGDAFTRSADRTGVAAGTALTRVGGAGASIVATYGDIEAMTSTLERHVTTTQDDAFRILPMAAGGDLLQSLILSPATGAAAEAAVLSCVTQLTVLVARSTGLGLIAVTIVSTYALADAALQAGAAAIGFVFDGAVVVVANSVDVTVAAAEAAIDVVVTARDGVVTVYQAGEKTVAALDTIGDALGIVLDGALDAFAAGYLGEAQSAWTDTLNAMQADPWLYVTDLDRVLQTFDANFSEDAAWSNSLHNFQGYLGSLGPEFDEVITGLIESAGVFGWEDGATFHTESSVDAFQDAARRLEFQNSVELLDSDLPSPDGDYQPEDLTTLLLSMGQTDSLGGKDEAVIRVLTQPGPPPTFTLIIPSTQQWAPWESVNPNDLMGNLAIMQGSSALETMADQALQTAMDDYYTDHAKDGIARADVDGAQVMVAGFSQGGITAAAFAQNHSDPYNIVQVVTAGAPIAGFDIPHDVSVIAFESPGDPVPTLDGMDNPAQWDTITTDNGGSGVKAHSSKQYAHLADNGGVPAKPNKLDQFLGGASPSIVTDYYAIKDSK